jgi:hypothetical protein
MKSFILALLPGLEEETSEFFEQVTVFPRRNGPTANTKIGLEFTRRTVHRCVTVLFSGEHLVNHADCPICPWYRSDPGISSFA